MNSTKRGNPTTKSVLQATLNFYTRNENLITDSGTEKGKKFMDKNFITQLSKLSEGCKIYKRKKRDLSSKTQQEKKAQQQRMTSFFKSKIKTEK